MLSSSDGKKTLLLIIVTMINLGGVISQQDQGGQIDQRRLKYGDVFVLIFIFLWTIAALIISFFGGIEVSFPGLAIKIGLMTKGLGNERDASTSDQIEHSSRCNEP